DFGGKARFSGTLLDRPGNPVAGAAIAVYQRVPEEAESQIAALTTGSDGGLSYDAGADFSRRLRFVYAGTEATPPAGGSAELLVHGASTLRVDRDHVPNGHSVTFSGQVEGKPLPEKGKLVELQVRLSHEWSTFRTTRSDDAGTWSVEYPFKRTCGIEEYR